MGKMSRDKGGRGENAVKGMAAAHDFTAVRSRSGGGQARSDLVGIPGMAVEVKWVERESVRAWWEQAAENCDLDVPVVAHKRNNRTWLATLELDELLAAWRRGLM
jgi:Holliday junction resolvase